MIKKILIVGPSWVGDMVMAQCLFKLLKQQNPSVILHVLAPEWTFPLLSRMSQVTKAIPLPIQHGELKLKVRFILARQLSQEHYDQAIVLPNSFKSALIPWLAKIPQRTGWLGEWRFGILNDYRQLDKKRYALMIEQFMALSLPAYAALPQPYPLPSLDIDITSQKKVLENQGLSLSGKPILALSPGAEFGPAKRWPTKHFAALALVKLAAGWDVWLFGSKKDLSITTEVNQLTENQCHNMAGKINLAETIDLLSLATLLVSNDSGLMHVAAALKKPVIGVYGATSPVFTPPLAEKSQVLKLSLDCQPCFARECPLKHHRCMEDLLPQQVLAVLAGWGY